MCIRSMCENVMSFTKPEVHNIATLQAKDVAWSCVGTFAMFGRVVSWI